MNGNEKLIILCSLLTIDYLCFSLSVDKYPNNPMLGRREIVNGKVNTVFCPILFSTFCQLLLMFKNVAFPCSLVNMCGRLIKKYMT